MVKVSNKEILQLAIPSIISNITVPLLGLIDLTIVGHIGNEDYISAIAVGTMVFNVIYWLLGFLRMGTSGLTSQAYGREDRSEYIGILLRTLTLGIAVGLCFIVLQKPMGWLLFRLIDTPPTSLSLVQQYFSIVIFGAPAMLGLYGLTGWFIGMQDTRAPMMIAIAQNIVNIIGSLGFVYGLHWDIDGVASGTLLAQWCGFVMATLIAYHKLLKTKSNRSKCSTKDRMSVSLLVQRHHLQVYVSALRVMPAWKSFFVLNRDIFFRTLCLVVVNFFFTKAGGKQGSMILAVNTLLMTLFTLFSYFMDGFAYAGEALSGKYYGAGERAALREVIRKLFYFGFIVVVVFTCLYAWGGQNFLHLLTSDERVVAASIPYLPWACLIPIAGVSAFIMDGIFIGLTETRGMLLSGFIAGGVFFLVYFIFNRYAENTVLWIAFLLFLFVRGIVELLWDNMLINKYF